MSIQAIRARLVEVLSEIDGIHRCFHDQPNVVPASADCPCIVLAWQTPSRTVRGAASAIVEYDWHFQVKFLYKPLGLGNRDENLSGAEDFIKLFVDKMAANGTGSGTWLTWNKDDATFQGEVGVITLDYTPADTLYWGWEVPLNIAEQVETTFSAGAT